MGRFKSMEVDALQVVGFPSVLSREEVEPLEAEIKIWLQSPKVVHVMDFAGVQKIDFRAYRAFIMYNKALRDAKKPLFCINLKPELIRQLTKDGLSAILCMAENLDDIRTRFPPEKSGVDVGILNPFIEATRNVLQTQANTTIIPGKPYLKKGEDPFPIEIAGLISLNSTPTFKGSVVICFQLKTFLGIYSKMVGEIATEITPEIQDGAGEMINIIYGQAKTTLNDHHGHKLGTALPTVLAGERLKIRHQSRETSIIVPFESEFGPLFIEIIIERN